MSFEEKNKMPNITASLFIFDYQVSSGYLVSCACYSFHRIHFAIVVLVYNLKAYFEFMLFKNSDVCITCVIYLQLW